MYELTYLSLIDPYNHLINANKTKFYEIKSHPQDYNCLNNSDI